MFASLCIGHIAGQLRRLVAVIIILVGIADAPKEVAHYISAMQQPM